MLEIVEIHWISLSLEIIFFVSDPQIGQVLILSLNFFIFDQTEPSEKFKSQLAEAEQLAAAIGGLRVPKSIFSWLTGAQADQVSFEIVTHRGLISFYMAVPEKLVSYMQQQIRSSYEEVELEDKENFMTKMLASVSESKERKQC